MIDSIRNYTIDQSSRCRSEAQWDYQQAVRWQKSNYREKYLGIEKFGKQVSFSRIEVEIEDFEPIEAKIKRTKKYKSTAFRKTLHLKMKPINTIILRMKRGMQSIYR